MENAWFILSSRYGGDTPAPTMVELRSALVEVYEETNQNLTLADYEEHPSAHVRYGTDTGPMYVLSVRRSGAATFEQWSDQDYGDELAEARTIERVSLEDALALCNMLQSGQIEALRREFESRAE